MIGIYISNCVFYFNFLIKCNVHFMDMLTHYDIIACNCPCNNKFLTSVKREIQTNKKWVINISFLKQSTYLKASYLPSAPPTYCPFINTCGTCWRIYNDFQNIIMFFAVLCIGIYVLNSYHFTYRSATGSLYKRINDWFAISNLVQLDNIIGTTQLVQYLFVANINHYY